jgi:hypothetical protein
VSEQADRHEVMIRCAVCERLRPGYATALLRMVPVPGPARWQVYRLRRLPAPVGAWQMGVPGSSELGVTTRLAADEDGTVPAPWVFPEFILDPPRSLQVECRGCHRAPFRVRHMAYADRAEALGDRDAYV